MSENVVQPGIEPGSPDYRSDAYKALKLTRSMRGWFSGRVVKASDR